MDFLGPEKRKILELCKAFQNRVRTERYCVRHREESSVCLKIADIVDMRKVDTNNKGFAGERVGPTDWPSVAHRPSLGAQSTQECNAVQCSPVPDRTYFFQLKGKTQNSSIAQHFTSLSIMARK